MSKLGVIAFTWYLSLTVTLNRVAVFLYICFFASVLIFLTNIVEAFRISPISFCPDTAGLHIQNNNITFALVIIALFTSSLITNHS